MTIMLKMWETLLFAGMGLPCALGAAARPWALAGSFARPLALGWAGGSHADPEAIFLNPSSLASLSTTSLTLNEQAWPSEPQVGGAALALPLAPGSSFGLGMNGYRGPLSGGSPGVQGLAGLAHQGGPFSYGGALRFLGPVWGSPRNSQGLGLDLGISLLGKRGPWGLSLAALNLPVLRQADSDAPGHWIQAAAWLPWRGGRFSLAVTSMEGEAELHGGAEVPAWKIFTLRMGLGSRQGLSGGLGMEWGQGLRLDYGVAAAGTLGVLQSLSLRIGFGGPASQAKKAGKARGPWTDAGPNPVAVSETPNAGDFALEAKLDGRHVALSWPEPEPGLSYQVTMGMLPQAKFRSLHAEPLAAPHWEGELGLAGVPYYFRVRSLRGDGSEGPSSGIATLQVH
jgi:hypothetical protein